MKTINLLLVFIFSTVLINAQTVDDVTLVVSGDGTTKEEATHVALRSAIEQAYGVFVSANTEILNDELVKDEIATVTSGNVKSYTELSATVLPSGNHLVTLQATVSTKSLATYAQSKGASCEFAGATFGANLKLIKLNQENTEKAFANLIQHCKTIAPYIVEPAIEVGIPTVNGEVPMKISLYSTPNTFELSELIISTLTALKLTKEQVSMLQNIGVEPHYLQLITCSYDIRLLGWDETPGWYWDYSFNQPLRENICCYYAPFPYNEMISEMKNALSRYYITDNLNLREKIDFSNCLVGGENEIWRWRDPSSDEQQDMSHSCYTFGNSGRIRLPYSYVKSIKSRKTKELSFPKQLIGEINITLNIPVEILMEVTKFEINQDI